MSAISKLSKQTKIVTGLTTLLLLVSGYTYITFANFRPDAPEPKSEVKGASDETIKLPYPQNYTIAGVTREANAEHITYSTTYTPDEVHGFYKNILTPDGWEINSTGSSGIFTTTKYYKKGKGIEVTTSQQLNQNLEITGETIVSLLIEN